MINICNLTLLEIDTILTQELSKKSQISFVAKNPDCNPKAIALKEWVALAELHLCTMQIPKVIDQESILITFKKLNVSNSFHTDKVANPKEKYGVDSKFFSIDKMQYPTFLLAYKRALKAVKVETREHILNLGINKGDEFLLIKELLSTKQFNSITFSGIDHCATAIATAKANMPQPNANFYVADINRLKELKLNRANLIISIGTLQSPSINYKPFLMQLVQEHLSSDGALILGFPNSRWIDNQLIYGAKAPNYPYSEMSLLFNDIIFAKKYLQQKKFRVTITGREYLFLTATKIG
jgi:hypothetical protein